MNSVQEDKIDKLSKNFENMEDQLREQVMDLKHKLLESKKQEEELLDQMKRRIGNISSISSSLNYKMDKCLAQEKSKSYEPQGHKSGEHQAHNDPQVLEESNPHYNNPFMNQQSSQIHPEKQIFKHQRFSSSKPEVRHSALPPPPPSEHVPQWQIDFPFINQDHVDTEMRKELWKSIPKTS
jgi:chemotaxis protein histidine kinase CheA